MIIKNYSKIFTNNFLIEIRKNIRDVIEYKNYLKEILIKNTCRVKSVYQFALIYNNVKQN